MNEATIWRFLKSQGMTDAGVAGLMGNLFAESGLNPKNLQNTYEKKLGYTDVTYTAAVDNGTYTNFVRDSAGYGLCQWTYWTRNGDVIAKLNEVQGRLDEHIRIDDERNADAHRVQILRFNRELLQDNIPHTQEDFIEALSEIDFYERYCKEHPEYENNRAVLAIQNIERVYSERLEKHDFL